MSLRGMDRESSPADVILLRSQCDGPAQRAGDDPGGNFPAGINGSVSRTEAAAGRRWSRGAVTDGATQCEGVA